MPEAEMTPKQRRQGSPLVRMLQEKLVSCLDEDGELNVTAVAIKIGRSRQGMHWLLNKEVLSAAVAYRLLENFKNELTIRDLKPFVARDDAR